MLSTRPDTSSISPIKAALPPFPPCLSACALSIMHRQAVVSNHTPQTAGDEAAAQYRHAILMQLGEDFFPFFDLASQSASSRPDGGLLDQLYAHPRKAGLDSEPASVSQERSNTHCTCCRAGCSDSAGGGAGPVRHNGRHHFGDMAAAPETAHRSASEKKLQSHTLPSAPGAAPPPACWPNQHGPSPEQWWLLSPSTEAAGNAQSARRSPAVFKPFDCRHCVKDFPKKADRDRHEASVHRGQMEKPPRMFYCNVNGCTRPRGFTRKDNLLDHVRRVHNLSIPKRQTRQQHLSERMSMG